MAAGSSAIFDIREEAHRKYECKRLQEGYIFLKTLTFDGDYEPEDGDESKLIEENYTITPSRNSYIDNEPSLTELSSMKDSSRTPRLSFNAAIEDELHLQKAHNYEDPQRKSKVTFVNSKDLAIVHLSSSSLSKRYPKQLTGKRNVLVSSHHTPFSLFSVIPYSHFHDAGKRGSITQSAAAVTISSNYIEDIVLGDGKKEVSYSHMLNPQIRTRKRFHSGAVNDDDYQHELVDYTISELDLLDDPQLTSGRHRTVLNLPSYMISIIQYAKPSKIKKDINERFKEKFPAVTITLTKLRSIKAEMLCISQKMSLDLAVVACAYLYFEKAILKTKITKHNRKYIAGACLLLSIKFSDDFTSKNIKACLDEISDQFRLSYKDLLSCELQVLILLEFSLLSPINEVLQLYKRLESAHSVPLML